MLLKFVDTFALCLGTPSFHVLQEVNKTTLVEEALFCFLAVLIHSRFFLNYVKAIFPFLPMSSL